MTEQQIWDKNLLHGWTLDVHIMRVLSAFLSEVKPELLDDRGYATGFREFLISLNLKRCLDEQNGKADFIGHGGTRPFIANRCERLNNCLWSEKYTEQELLDSIDAFIWRKHGAAIQAEVVRRHRKKVSTPAEIRLKMRELSKKHDWKTVK